MPIEGVAEAVVDVAVQAAGEVVAEAGQKAHRRFGWIGCLLAMLIAASIGVGLYFVLAD